MLQEFYKRDIIAGKNAVLEALKTDKQIDTIFMATDCGGSSGKIKAMAKDKSIIVKMVSKQKLDFLSEGVNHQGVVAECSCAEYSTVEDILNVSKEKGTNPFIIIADEIEDPHNLGAIIRTAEACGADGIIIPKRRSASLNATVYKTSAGAASVVKVARVSNIVSCLKELKAQNVWIYGADMDGKSWDKENLTGAVGLVIGSEGKGISRIVKEECDFIISLPMNGSINSLNASVAAGILMYEVVRQRNS